jgi:galactokinase
MELDGAANPDRSSLAERAAARFRAAFGGSPAAVAFAPGRVNLIGEHVDYNDGRVLPLALARGIAVALARVPRAGTSAVSEDRGAAHATSGSDPGFARYPEAARRVLARRGLAIPGLAVAIVSDLPVGAGLSSSAALLVATLRAAARAADATFAAVEIARLAHEAERDEVGVACGVMDHFACALGVPGEALAIDCQDGATRRVAVPESLGVWIVDSGLRRELANSAYNARVAECREAVAVLAGFAPGLRSLRDADRELLERAGDALAGAPRRRARHVVTEIARVAAFEAALAGDDAPALGALLDASHASLRDDFEVSLPPLDALARALTATPGCHGARLTGAGFGGCLVALGDPAAFSRVAAAARAALPTSSVFAAR